MAAWPLLGRERELEEIRDLVVGNARLVTLTGAGGSGKTRLALQAAAELSDQFPDGVFFVALAPLRDTAAVPRDGRGGARLAAPTTTLLPGSPSRRALLVLDNLEHLDGVAAPSSELLVGETVVLATSRAPLHLSAERELPVEPLPSEAAVELFVSRAAAAGRVIAADETSRRSAGAWTTCRSRSSSPPPGRSCSPRPRCLRRLDAALPLLTGGARDLPERQQTLRATIEWSHELLDPDAQVAFRRLSVFRGSFTLEAAEAITGADLDPIASLVDQSLLKPLGDDRFFLLETLREYAGERLDAAGETEEYALRHARWYLERLEEIEHQPSRGAELFSWYRLEDDNLRAMLDQLTAADVADAARAAVVLSEYWVSRSAWSEARQRVDILLGYADLPDQERAKLFLILARRADRLRDLDAAEAAALDALALATPGTFERAQALKHLGWVAGERGNLEQAARFADDALAESASLDAWRRAKTRLGIAQGLLQDAKRTPEARALLEDAHLELRRAGDELGALVAEINLGEIDLYARQYDSALAILPGALERSRQIGHIDVEAELLREIGLALLGCVHRSDARATFTALLDLVAQNPDAIPELTNALAGIALAAEPVEVHRAARLRGAVDNLRRTNNVTDFPATTSLEHDFEQRLIDALDDNGAWAREQAAGAILTLDETIELARTLTRAEAPVD